MRKSIVTAPSHWYRVLGTVVPHMAADCHGRVTALRFISMLLMCGWLLALDAPTQAEEIATDLLIVGGTESGCAAAVAAARAGVPSIVLVNDIDWLGGQFSAEGLAAIDENRGPEGYGHGVPFPRSGLFREVIDGIEALNLKKYGHPRPGNTRVITTARPVDAEQVFRELLTPYIECRQLRVISRAIPEEALLSEQGTRLDGVRFACGDETITIRARLTLDASDWGDIIKLSGAAYEFGPDLQETYGEPLAPRSREDYPVTDMNPITYCMLIEETANDALIPEPSGYDPRHYRAHSYPSDPLWLYESRRIVDHYNLAGVTHPDVLLLCFPAFDYPLDVYPAALAAQLEATEPGASRKNIVELTRPQRELVFQNARDYSLGFLHYLQTEVHDAMPDQTHSFRRFRLSREFGTDDHLPPKPYIRESVRLKAMYMLKQQDTTGYGERATNYALTMPHDGIASWQFEYDFHPTRRQFLTDDAPAGPWTTAFRPCRTWGPPYSGRALFPLRCLVPETMNGLLGGQKNLGYTSIVSSAVRLHDQSMAIGQGAGAVAAVAIAKQIDPREIPWNRHLLSQVWGHLTAPVDEAMPQALWPFGDLDPTHRSYAAVQQLAVRQLLPLGPTDITFDADASASLDWRNAVRDQT
ncbi:MAG: FAD-dependent oxidoreductase, partial [Planctomycetaceae bacterium]|nr:FAD-dependent oxidoreductase [Planctomycetaceae bacterium]